MIIPAGYICFKEFELFNGKSASNEFSFVAEKGKLQMSNLCFLEPVI